MENKKNLSNTISKKDEIKPSDRIKGLIDGAIQNECHAVYESNYSDMSDENKNKYAAMEEEARVIYEKLVSSLDESQIKLVNKYMDLTFDTSTILQDFMFRSGVMAGFKQLNYIKKSMEGVLIF